MSGMPPASDRTPRLSLLDAAGAVIDSETQSLGFGLFDRAFERQFCPGAPHYDERDPILDELDEARSFVGADSRRFHVRVEDDAPPAIGILADGRRFVTARWSTRDEHGAPLDDNAGASRITLIEERPGVFLSRGLLLVSWEQDRDLATHCGISGLHSAARERRGRGESDHRVRLASLTGDVVVEYPSDDAAAHQRLVARPFQPCDRLTLPLQLFVASRRGTRQPVATTAELGAGLERTRRIYAALGIGVRTVTHPLAEVRHTTEPRAVRRIERALGGDDVYYVVDAGAWLGWRDSLAAFDERAFARFCRVFPDAGRVVRVLYVDAFRDGRFAMAYPDFDFAGRVEAGACACQAERYPDRALTAHEVGHVLTDKGSAYGTVADQTSGYPQRGGHFGRPATPPDNRYLHFYNLMGGSRYRLWDVDVTEGPPAAPDVRTFNQYRDVRASPYLR